MSADGEDAWREPSDADLDEQLFAADQAEAADEADEAAHEADVAAYAAACDTTPPVTSEEYGAAERLSRVAAAELEDHAPPAADPAEDLWALLGRVVSPLPVNYGRRP